MKTYITIMIIAYGIMITTALVLFIHHEVGTPLADKITREVKEMKKNEEK